MMRPRLHAINFVYDLLAFLPEFQLVHSTQALQVDQRDIESE
jgi:hypothetical protein